MICSHCQGRCVKKGFQKNGTQRYKCLSCGKLRQENYKQKARRSDLCGHVVKLLRIGCTRRGIARYLEISFHSVQKAILKRASEIESPMIPLHQSFEIDELRTYIGNKKRQIWLVTALRRDSGMPVLFHIGRRTKSTLRRVTDSVLLSEPRRIYTDRLELYQFLIPRKIHKMKEFHTNRVERLHLSLRTHLRFLSRKTICCAKSLVMAVACIRVYYWS